MLILMYCEVVLGVSYCVYSVVRCVCVCMCVCVCVRRRATAAFLALLTSLVGLCKLIFVTASLQSYTFVRRQRIVYLSQLPIRKPTRKAERFWI